MLQKTSLALLATALLLLTTSVRAGSPTIEEALELSQQTGKPLLAVAGRSTCGNTTAMEANLRNPLLAQSLSNYVTVSIDVDKPEYNKWFEKHGQPEGTLPFVYVLRADGTKISTYSGYKSLPETQKFIATDALKAGRSLNKKETAQVEKALATAKQAEEKGDLAAALRAFSTVRKLGVMSDTKSYAKPVVDANQLVTAWTEKARTDLATATETLTSEAPTFDAALVYLQTKKTYAQLPGLKPDLATASKKIDQNKKLADLLKQAGAFHTAQLLPTATPASKKKAIEAYTKITTTHPNTEAATRAAAEIENLSTDSKP